MVRWLYQFDCGSRIDPYNNVPADLYDPVPSNILWSHRSALWNEGSHSLLAKGKNLYRLWRTSADSNNNWPLVADRLHVVKAMTTRSDENNQIYSFYRIWMLLLTKATGETYRQCTLGFDYTMNTVACPNVWFTTTSWSGGTGICSLHSCEYMAAILVNDCMKEDLVSMHRNLNVTKTYGWANRGLWQTFNDDHRVGHYLWWRSNYYIRVQIEDAIPYRIDSQCCQCNWNTVTSQVVVGR